ncbi:MAG TPA: surface lipoprotein assembly modifier [Gammaproteobacteria bacterium]|nr:surface lipoprotein assembly modifier [Gammaproteobacteria bacterium]
MTARLGWALGLLLGTALAAPANAGLDLERLQRLVERGRMERAYELALVNRAANEGRLRFDFYYGVAAIDTGHVAEGVFALERVLMHRPGLDRARLELARGYFMLGEDRRARQEFRTVLGHQPPEAVQATVERFLEAMRRRSDRYQTVVTAYAELAGGYDSNVNSATDADSVAIFDGLLELRLNGASQAQEDAFWQTSAGGEVRKPLSPSTGVFGSLDVRVRGHARKTAYNTGQVRFRAGWEWRGDFSRLRLSARMQPFYLDSSVYQDRWGVGADYRYSLSDTTAATAFARGDRLRYPGQPIRDSKMWTAGAGLSHLFVGALRPAVSATVFGGQELADDGGDAARAIAERDLYGAQLGLRFVPDPNWTLELSGQVRRSEYGAEHQLFLRTREETYYQADAGLTWRISRHWSAGPHLRYSRNDANIAIYDYDRTQAWLRLRYDHF